MSERELVKLVTIDSVTPVPNSANLDAVKVGGWIVVSQRGLYKPGDQAWYHEIDSLLPLDNPAYAFLGARGIKEVDGKQYHRLKTVKLRGQISQGLLVPFEELKPIVVAHHDSLGPGGVGNYTEALGVLKFDDVVTVNAGNSDTAGSFPTKYGQKTDAERVQNLAPFWDQIKANGPWHATEKIDGCSLSVFRDEDGELLVCSRNWRIKEGDNVYWNALKHLSFVTNVIEPGEGFQGEIFGSGIQKNRLGMKFGPHIRIFNWLQHGVAIPVHQWPSDYVRSLAVPEYKLELPDTIEEAIAQADGIKSLISPERYAEGIVWTQEDGKVLDCLGRHAFKVISNTYLLKEK